MRKLKLDVDALQVESFEAHTGDAHAIGTVRANVITPNCSAGDECSPTYFEATCNCADTSPRPSCIECSWDSCLTSPNQCD